MAKIKTTDPEIEAISHVHAALKGLEPGAQERVLSYVSQKLGLPVGSDVTTGAQEPSGERIATPREVRDSRAHVEPQDEGDAINAVAQKWMRRSGLTVEQLSNIFSIGGDEIELVARKVPGSSKRDRMRNVFLLKGIAAYLGSGAPRVSYEDVKEACLHYNAFDNTNFSKYLKGMATEVSGTKQSGYTLTARGLSEGTDVVKNLLGLTPKD